MCFLYQLGINEIYHFGILLSRGDLMKTRLKQLREKKNYTQQKVALDLNMNQNSVSRYENDEREAGYDQLVKFADYYNVSVDYILCRTDNPKTNR